MTAQDPWAGLRRLTAARIALGRAGDGLPTARVLEFQLAHARARDSVWTDFDSEMIMGGVAGLGLPAVLVRTAAADRAAYLRDPSLGRRLAAGESARLARGDWDAAVVVTDGLSARAVHQHALATLAAMTGALPSWRLAPVVVAPFGRVALADEIGAALGASMTVILVGERPGLSSADSLGAYLTWDPRPGRQNAERNCVSNIRPDGLDPALAGMTVARLMRMARQRRLTGVGLKDEGPGITDSAPPKLGSAG
ncbi:MAG: ethanolamine ammonia-lyase subunit EutC [Thalassobaculales bacterium]